MADLIVDFTEAVEFDNTPAPAGIYPAVIDASETGEIKYGKEKGTPYFKLNFIITQEGDFEGKKLSNNYMLAGKGTGNLKRLLSTFGLYTDDQGTKIKFNPASLHNLECRIRVAVRNLPDSGDPVNDIKAVMLPE
ncbi:MAG: hypothetical protein PHR07_08030 [Acidaminococcaceae bacterium]|nr:hypothetical protein [Acidaminococcaceae bacterium]